MPSPDDIRILSVAAFILLMIMGMKRPVWAVLAYMVLVYCKLSAYYPVFAAMQAEAVFAIIILARVLLGGELFSRLSLKNNKINQYLLLFVLCVMLSYAVAWDRQYSWDMAVYHFIKVLTLYLMLVGAVLNRQDLYVFFIGLMLMFGYLAYEPTYYFMTGTGGSTQVYGINYIAEIGLLSGHVALANNMNQMIPLALFSFLGFKSRTLKIVAFACLTMFVLSLMGSGSRGGVAGFAFFGMLMIYFSRNRTKALILVGIPLLILVLATGRMSSTLSRIDSDAVWGRLVGLTHGIGMLQRGNIIGVGPGCFPLARRSYFDYKMESHNIYGQVIGDLGIPGTLCWGLLVYAAFQSLSRSKQRLKEEGKADSFLFFLAQGVQISLLVRLFVSLGSHGLYYFYWYVMFFLSAVISDLVEKESLVDEEEKGLAEGIYEYS